MAAGRLGGAMLFAGGCSGFAWILLPGPELQMRAAAIRAALAVVAGAGTALVPWGRLSSTCLYWVPLPALVVISGVIATTGAVVSPARFYLMMVDVFAAYYFKRRWAAVYAVGCLAVHASPLLYDFHATHAVFVGELIVVAPVYIAVAAVVVTAKRRLVNLHAQAEAESRFDPLTRLANRRGMIETLDRWNAETDAHPFGLILLDLDDLKSINTMHGHAGGDRALVAIADVLRECTRASGLAVRLGGDEFALLIRDASDARFGKVADRIVREVAKRGHRLAVAGVCLSASAGWATWPDDALTPYRLLAAADRGLTARRRMLARVALSAPTGCRPCLRLPRRTAKRWLARVNVCDLAWTALA